MTDPVVVAIWEQEFQCWRSHFISEKTPPDVLHLFRLAFMGGLHSASAQLKATKTDDASVRTLVEAWEDALVLYGKTLAASLVDETRA